MSLCKLECLKRLCISSCSGAVFCLDLYVVFLVSTAVGFMMSCQMPKSDGELQYVCYWAYWQLIRSLFRFLQILIFKLYFYVAVLHN